MIDDKKILAVTLARGGSKKIKNKNFVNVAGQPLIKYTFDAAKSSKYIDKYIVSTDSEDIMRICDDNNVEYITRPSHLSQDTSTSSSALVHAVNNVDLKYDYVVELMITNPLKSADDIDACLVKLHSNNLHSVVSVVRLHDHHPSRIKFLDEKGVMKDFYPETLESRRQDLTPSAYIRNGSIYVMKTKFLLDHQVRYDKNSVAYIMDEERSINIDEPIDLILAEAILKNRTKHYA
jgi:CMP-N,N'-diacetyllegionaminic acid synthase